MLIALGMAWWPFIPPITAISSPHVVMLVPDGGSRGIAMVRIV